MPLDTVAITGELHHPDGSLAKNEPVTIVKVVKAGSLITLLPKTVRSHATTGVVTLTLPSDSTAYLYAKVNGLDTGAREGVALPIPADDADLEDLVAVAAVPSTGITVKDEGTALTDLVGTFDFVGSGVAVTQASAGVATVTITSGGVTDATFITQTPSAGLSAEQALSTLATGLLKNTTATGVLSIATAADIPSLDAAKITSGQFADARIASAAAWNAKQDALGFTAENAANKNQANGYAGLDGSSKLNPSHLPAIAISNYLGSVASQVAMLALTGERGDWAIRSDLNQTFIIIGDDPTQLADWQGLATPTDLVSSVFGRAGAVTAQANDYTFAQLASKPTTLSGYGISDAQSLDATLTALAGLTVAADKLIYATGADAFGVTDLSAFGRSLIDDANAGAAQLTLELVIGTNVQAFSARLSEVATIGSALQQIRVNAGATALEYFTPSVGGSQTPWTANIDADGFNLLFDDATGILSSETGNPELLLFTSVPSAVNELTVTNAATGDGPAISATGGDANIPLTLTPKGSGNLVLNIASNGQIAVPVNGSASAPAIYFQNSAYGIFQTNGVVQLSAGGSSIFGVTADGQARVAANGALGFSSNQVGNNSLDAYFTRSTAGILGVTSLFEFTEVADPSAPASNKARLYVRDNGSGKTQIVVVFPSGAVQVIATEP